MGIHPVLSEFQWNNWNYQNRLIINALSNYIFVLRIG